MIIVLYVIYAEKPLLMRYIAKIVILNYISEEIHIFFNKKISPKYDNIFTLSLKKRLRSQKELREIMRERERKEKEKYEMEQKKILKEVNQKYDSIRNDLPIPFYLSKDQLDKLIHLDNEKYIIFLQEFVVGKMVLYLPRSHLFHSICISRWLINNNKCPICQTDYRAKADDDEKKEEEDI